MCLCVHKKQNSPNFTWKTDEFINLLSEARNLQGRLMGKMETLGFELRDEASFETLTIDFLKSAEIKKEILNPNQFRSSIAQRLGIDFAGITISDRNAIDFILDCKIDLEDNILKQLDKFKTLKGLCFNLRMV